MYYHCLTAMKLITLPLALSLLSLNAFSQSEEKKQIRDLWDRFETAFDEGNARAVAMLYAEDADRIDIRGNVRRGRDEIEAHYARAFKRREAVPYVAPLKRDIAIRVLRDDVAIVDGVTVLNAEETIHFSVVLTKRKGEWLMIAARPKGLMVK